MAHLRAYDSFQTKKVLNKKEEQKKSHYQKKEEKVSDFIIDKSDEYGVVIEVRYDDAYVLVHDEKDTEYSLQQC